MLLRWWLGKEVPDKEQFLHPSIFTFFTSLYAFFLGFAIVTLWSAFLNAEFIAAREADALLSAHWLSKDLPKSEGFRQALAEYVKSVVEEEWPAMENFSMSPQTIRRLSRVWDQLRLIRAEIKGDNELYVAVAGHLSEASRQRLSRALLINGNLYPPVWVIIVFGFLTVVYGLYFFHIRHSVVRVVFDFMVLFVVLSCIYFIYDINTPFSGYVVVKPDVFKQVYAIMLAAP